MIVLSIIIPTRNRCDLLAKTLQSISSQHYPADQFEVIVVDNGSTDRTRMVVENEGKIRNLHYVFEEKPGLHEGRHTGMRHAKGRVLVYADDDIDALPSWLEGIDESFHDPRVGLVGGKDIPLYETPPPEWIDELWEVHEFGKSLSYYSLLDFGDTIREVHSDFIFGCNFSIRKDLLLQIKGFHPDGMPDNMLRYRGDGETFVGREIIRLGYKVIYNPKASVRHFVSNSRMNHQYIEKRTFMAGVSQSYTDTRACSTENKLKGWFRPIYNHLRKMKQSWGKRGLQRKILHAYYAGYAYHQSEMKKDSTLREWVLKDNYL